MNEIAGSNVIWSLIVQSDFVTQLVMVTLFFMSVICWAIALYKLILLRIKKNQCDTVIEEMKQSASLPEVLMISQQHRKTLPGYVLVSLLTSAKQAKDHQAPELFQLQADGILDDVMYQEESYTSVLSISASISTLLGLFGTVWGLVHAFVRISEKQSADIVTVAPGISEALITTIAGLVVAIPALVFYQYIMVRMRDLEYKLVHITDKVTLLVRLSMGKQVQKDLSDVTERVAQHDQSIF